MPTVRDWYLSPDGAVKSKLDLLDRITYLTSILLKRPVKELRSLPPRAKATSLALVPMVLVARQDYGIEVILCTHYYRTPYAGLMSKVQYAEGALLSNQSHFWNKIREIMSRIRLGLQQPETINLPFYPDMPLNLPAEPQPADGLGTEYYARYKTKHGYIDQRGQIILRPPG